MVAPEGTRGNSANEYPPKLAMHPNRLSFPAMPRTRPLLLWIAALSLLLGVAGGSYAKAVQTEHVEAELVAARTAAEPGSPLRIGLRLKMDEHWHTYWRNPGDTGLPTTIQWQLPAGFQAGDIEWPAPQRIDVGPFANYGYEGEVVLPRVARGAGGPRAGRVGPDQGTRRLAGLPRTVHTRRRRPRTRPEERGRRRA